MIAAHTSTIGWGRAAIRRWSPVGLYGASVAVVVGVHGIGQQDRTVDELLPVWASALQSGLTTTHFPQMGADALAVAFFGDLFKMVGGLAADSAPYTAADIEDGTPEAELVAVWYAEAVRLDPSLGSPPDAMMQRAPLRAQVMFLRVLESPLGSLIDERALVGVLKQVAAYLHDGAVKAEVLGRVHGAVGPDTRVIVGHSLGSVVTYEYLAAGRAPQVDLLVTLGSPLGIPRIIFDELTPRPRKVVASAGGRRGVWPGTVGQWVNIANPYDLVALRKELADMFDKSAGGTGILDRSVDKGQDPHAIGPYLDNDHAAEAIGPYLFPGAST